MSRTFKDQRRRFGIYRNAQEIRARVRRLKKERAKTRRGRSRVILESMQGVNDAEDKDRME